MTHLPSWHLHIKLRTVNRAQAIRRQAAIERPAVGSVEARDWSGASPIRYPDPAIRSLDPRFKPFALGHTPVQRLYTGTLWVEGKPLNAPNDSDGIRADIAGNIWSAAGWGGEGFDGVHIFAPNGDRIGQIMLPESCANPCFGGRKRHRLFMAGSQCLYTVYVETQGAHMA